MSNVFVCVCVCVLWFPILSVCVLSARQRGGFRQRNGERIRGEDKKNQGLVWDCSSSFSLIDGAGGEGNEAFLCLFSFLSVLCLCRPGGCVLYLFIHPFTIPPTKLGNNDLLAAFDR